MSSKQTFVSNKIIRIPLLPKPKHMQEGLQNLLTNFGSVKWVDKTTSTNLDLYTQARNSSINSIKPWLLGTHLQEQGRGRLGRTWQNSSGAHLMFSCAFDVFIPARMLPSISILCGITACEALRGLLQDSCKKNLNLKWPNDIMWHQQKLAGILVEVTKAQSIAKAKDHHTVIVGIGINLNDARALSTSLNRQIADWTEIVNEGASIKGINATNITYAIAKSWYYEMNRITSDGLDKLQSRFANIDALYGKQINIIDNDKIINSGLAVGVNELGQLLVKSPNGIDAVNIGEVSVRPNKTPSMP